MTIIIFRMIGPFYFSPGNKVYQTSMLNFAFKIRCLYLSLLTLIGVLQLHAQSDTLMVIDSLRPMPLEEVIIIMPEETDHLQTPKPLSNLESYLEGSEKVNFVKRGAYAWEPVVNNMSSERLVLTIDGMRIFGACTDRMDPITSYVDVSNLSKACVESGQQASQYGSSVGGGLDLCVDQPSFGDKNWKGSIETGYESNNNQRILGGKLVHSNRNFSVSGDLIFRKADNYKAGGGQEVLYSQFEKFNMSLNTAYRISSGKTIRANFIFDDARNIGYPALPMDVSLARGIIGSLSFEQDKLGNLTNWQSKVYANSITHIMDDSQRPDVPIRMDMPGWSDTYGFYSQAELHRAQHHMLFKWDGYYNRSLAEMTMYPNDPEQIPMFMLTWPDVRTANSGLYFRDRIKWESNEILVAFRGELQNNRIASEFGLKSLQIFYPDLIESQFRSNQSISINYIKSLEQFMWNIGMAYGSRAPSVSEAYGFYLFNSNDNHDYIGNPNLKNEQSFELNTEARYTRKKLLVKASASFFHMPNYIIGEIDPVLSTMTIGADGVKVYDNLQFARLLNLSLNLDYSINKNLKAAAGVIYGRGVDHSGRNLPFIAPLSYRLNLSYHKKSWSLGTQIQGAGTQRHFSVDFAEDQTPAYGIVAFHAGKNIRLGNNLLQLKLGLENLFDLKYHTYSDWNNINRMGRNLFISASYNLY